MPLECGTIVGLERGESNVGRSRPQQRDQIESRHAPLVAEELAHHALGPVPAHRPSDPARGDNPQSAPVETVRKHEQSHVTAMDADALPLHAEELPAPPNPVAPRKTPIHVSHRRDHGSRKELAVDPYYTERRFRPLARRLLRTSLPVFVLMRLRNPCVRLRRRLFG